MIEVNAYLSQLTTDTVEIMTFIKTEVADLDESRLSHKSDSRSWSILECVEHMNIATRHYIDIIAIKLPQALSGNTRPVKYFKRGLLGKLSIKAMSPTANQEIKSKVKTFSRFEPVTALSKGKSVVIGEFLQLNETLLDQLSKASQVNVNTIRIKSGIGSIIRFKLPDAFGFVVGHNQRHILQIKRLLQGKN